MAEKWAIVTGASSGIGYEMARQLAERGYNLVLVARSQGPLESLQSELQRLTAEIHVVPLDLTRPGACEELVRKTDAWGLVPEVLVNNAGVGAFGSFLDSTPEEVSSMLELNGRVVVQLSHLYGRKMRDRGLGYILQVASTAAFQPLPQYAVYAATKSLVLNFSRAFNYEAKPFGVSSTALCPGPTATSFFAAAHHELNAPFKMLMMKPAEVARQGLEALFQREEVHISGFMNKITAALPRLVPSKLVVKSAALFTK